MQISFAPNVLSLILCLLSVAASPAWASEVVLSGPPVPLERTLFPFDAWVRQQFRAVNRGREDREIFITSYFDEIPDQQFGRRMWVPGGASRVNWLLMRTPPSSAAERAVEAKGTRTLLLERLGNLETEMLTKDGERALRHYVRCSREVSKTLLLCDAGDREAEDFLAAVEIGGKMRYGHHTFTGEPFPPVADAYDGLEYVVLATDRIFTDQAGLQALQHWVRRGGRLWVMLDQVSLAAVQALLLDGGGVVPVDEVGLTAFTVEASADSPASLPEEVREFEEPVRMLRVVADGFESELEIDGWPALLRKAYGDGELLLTTLAARGWHRPASSTDQRIDGEIRAGEPFPTAPCNTLAMTLTHNNETHVEIAEVDWPRLASGEIGYRVTGASTAGGILAAFCTFLLISGLIQWRRGRLFKMIWLAPGGAAAATLVLLVLAARSRAAVPPTESMLQFAQFDWAGNVLIRGASSLYQDAAGPIAPTVNELGTVGFAQPPAGAAKRLVRTDDGIQRWENLELSAGIHQLNIDVLQRHDPGTAVLSLNEDGLVGRVAGLRPVSPSAGVLALPGGRLSAVRIDAEGELESSSADVLPAGQFLTDGVLGDVERLQVDVYRQLLAGRRRVPERPRFYYWDDPFELDSHWLEHPREIEHAVISLPVKWVRPPNGERYILPASLLFYRSVRSDAWGASTLFNNRTRQWNESISDNSYTTLEFSAPDELLPLNLEQIKGTVDVHAPSRRLRILDGQERELKRWDSPVGTQEFTAQLPVRLDRVHPTFTLLIHLSTPETVDAAAASQQRWRIDDAAFEAWATSAP